MCMQTITSGFHACGIYPCNPDSILKERLMPSDKGSDSEGNELNSKSSSNDVSDLTGTPIQNLNKLIAHQKHKECLKTQYYSHKNKNISYRPNFSIGPPVVAKLGWVF